MNDSVLVQSYVEAYDLSYPEALRRIEKEVDELKNQLEEEGHYLLDNLGELSVNQDGNYEFVPCESGILSPELYGLGSFQFKRLKDEAVTEETVQPLKTVAKSISLSKTDAEETQLLDFIDDDNDSAISIKMSWIRNAVAIAAAIVAFFCIATPITNSDLGTEAMTHLQNSILYKLIPQDTTLPAIAEPVISEPTVTVAKPVEVKEPIAAKIMAEKPAEKPVAEPKAAITTYCIIVASQVKLSNAEQYVERLKKEGYPNAYVYINNNTVYLL